LKGQTGNYIKSYHTNLEECVIDNERIIERYHERYKIEQAFRSTKQKNTGGKILRWKTVTLVLRMKKLLLL
jgi:hypothetical protein